MVRLSNIQNLPCVPIHDHILQFLDIDPRSFSGSLDSVILGGRRGGGDRRRGGGDRRRARKLGGSELAKGVRLRVVDLQAEYAIS